VPDKSANPNLTRSFNKMQFQVSQMIEDIISSNPDFEPDDMFKSYEFEKQVKASKAVWNDYEKTVLRRLVQHPAGHSVLITTGMAIEELVYDASMKGAKVFREIWGEQPMTLDPGYGRCYGCGYSGGYDDFHQWDNPDAGKEHAEMSEAASAGDGQAQQALMQRPLAALPQCSKCGSFETDVAEPIVDSFPSIVGLEQFQLGDFRLNNLPLQATRFDVSGRPEDSSYFIDKQYFPLSKIKHMFGRDIEISESDGDVCLDYLQKMARIGASIGGARMDFSGGRQAKVTTLVRMSLSLDLLAEIDIPNTGDLETVSGGDAAVR
jgi:hypothetical protein